MDRSSAHRLRRARSLPFAGFIALALALVASACGDDDDAATPDTASSSATTAAGGGTETTEGGNAATGDPVTIVAMLDETGPSPTGGREVVQATVDAINDDGGLAGHPIEVSFVDTRGDAATAEAAVDDVGDAVAVVLSSPSTEAATADSLSALGVPIVGVGYQPGVWGGTVNFANLSCAASPDFCANANFLTITTTFDAVVAEQVLAAQNVGATTLVTAACAEVDSCAQATPVFEAVADEFGLAHVPTVRINSTAADYASECIGFIQDGVDFVQISASSSAGVKLIESCLDQGFEGTFGASAGSVDAALLGAPGAMAGGLNAFPWFVDDEPVAQYRDRMEAGGVSEELYSTANATGLYSALLLLQAGITDNADDSAPLDGAAALVAMYQVSDEDLDGLIQPVTFTEDNLDRTRTCFWPFTKDDDGNLENPLGGLTMQCYPEQ